MKRDKEFRALAESIERLQWSAGNEPMYGYDDIIDSSFFDSSNSSATRIYQYSNEHLYLTMPPYEYKDKSVLTVGSSGDQAFMALFLGAKDVTIVDRNPMAHFFIELKKAAFLNLSLDDFIKFLSDFEHGFMCIFNERYYSKISHDLDEKSKLFWDSLVLDGIDKIKCIDFYHSAIEVWIQFPYYASKDSYEKMRGILREKQFVYRFMDVAEVPLKLNKKYDIILLSNVFDYMALTVCKKMLNDIIKRNLSSDGFIQVIYTFSQYGCEREYESLECFYGIPKSKCILQAGNGFGQIIYCNGKSPKLEVEQDEI